ncbi:MAG: hypothetical protein JZU65_05145 [Chlorobium sp.]|nr:hypothetical protein [Chlorobium sp.]
MNFNIEVPGKEFVTAMMNIEKMVKKLKPLDLKAEYFGDSLIALKRTNKGEKVFDLMLQRSGLQLHIITSFTTISIPATGTSDVVVFLPGHFIMKVYSTFTKNEAVNFSLSGALLKVGTLSIPCAAIPLS